MTKNNKIPNLLLKLKINIQLKLKDNNRNNNINNNNPPFIIKINIYVKGKEE